MIIPRMIYIPLCDLRKGTIELLINCNQMAYSFFIVVLNLMNIENYIENYKFLKNNFKWKSFFPFLRKIIIRIIGKNIIIETILK